MTRLHAAMMVVALGAGMARAAEGIVDPTASPVMVVTVETVDVGTLRELLADTIAVPGGLIELGGLPKESDAELDQWSED